MQEEPESKKIILVGLDNAGKTTISSCLSGETRLDAFFNINPTIDYEIEHIQIGNIDIGLWDLGGQEHSRLDHLEQYQFKILGADKIFLVIDIQDSKRIDLALDYFEKILSFLKEDETEPKEIILLLHKYDKGFDEEGKFTRDYFLEKIIKPIKEWIPEKSKLTIFKSAVSVSFSKTEFL